MTTNPKIIPSLSYRLYLWTSLCISCGPKSLPSGVVAGPLLFFLFLLSSTLKNPCTKHNEAVKMRTLLDTTEMFSFQKRYLIKPSERQLICYLGMWLLQCLKIYCTLFCFFFHKNKTKFSKINPSPSKIGPSVYPCDLNCSFYFSEVTN